MEPAEATKAALDLGCLGSGDTSLRLGVLSPEEAARCFAEAASLLEFEEMVGVGGQPLPRVQCLLAASEDGRVPIYRYPGNEEGTRYPTHELSPLARRVCQLAATELSLAHAQQGRGGGGAAEASGYFNHVVVNYYRDETDFIAAHQDKRLDIERGTVIGALSVYPSAAVAPRELELLSTDGNKRRQVIALPQGSLFLLGDRTNQEFQHSVRPATVAATAASAPQARISFTLRRCATFRTPNGELVGQGGGLRMLADGSVRRVGDAGRALEVLYSDDCYVVRVALKLLLARSGLPHVLVRVRLW